MAVQGAVDHRSARFEIVFKIKANHAILLSLLALWASSASTNVALTQSQVQIPLVGAPLVLVSLLQTALRPLQMQGLQRFDNVYILELVTQFLRRNGYCSLTADNHVGQLTQ